MSKCEECGREVLFPFGCCYCRKAFCDEHLRPENHRCPKPSKLMIFGDKNKRAMGGEIPKFRKFMYSALAFCLILIVSSSFIAHISCHFGSRELRDPTYQEALQFIESDQTDKNPFIYEEYTCADFATDFKNNAFKAGYRCGYVLVFFSDLSHALNCFNTTDHGLIFVEPQEDAIVTLKIGQPYWTRIGYTPRYYGRTVNDTVTGFLITW